MQQLDGLERKLGAFASVRLGAETKEGFVLLPEGGDVLVGIEFLRQFGKTLTLSVGQGVVELTDDK